MPLLFSRLGVPDDYFKSIKHLEDKQRKMYDAQVVVLAILATRYFHGNFVSAGLYISDHRGVNLIDKSGLNHTLVGMSACYILDFIRKGFSILLHTETENKRFRLYGYFLRSRPDQQVQSIENVGLWFIKPLLLMSSILDAD